MFLMIREVSRFLVSKWTKVCYILIILYVLKDDGFTGAILPCMLFVWVMIVERVTRLFYWFSNTSVSSG
jgi:hypothetical protein